MGLPKALSYAEDQLGVHRTWVDCQGVAARLATLYSERAGYESETRSLNHSIETLKNELLVAVTMNNTDAGPTAIERMYRLACAESGDLTNTQSLLVDAMARRDAVSAEIYGAETNHKAYVARLRELGGYFEYLASVKQAETLANLPRNEWPY